MNSLAKCLLVVAGLTSFLFSCTKESFTDSFDAKLRISDTALHFDTVFTSTGSTSQFIKIFNDNEKAVKISSVRIAGGVNSPFKINVDGLPGPEVKDIEVYANDSAYAYVTVSIDPTSSNLPFIIRDSIEIKYNGNTSFVKLEAYGQNAKFLRENVVFGNQVWEKGLPYVLIGQCTILPNATLTINKGARIYAHADAPIVVQGTLIINGGKDSADRVIITGDRLDEPYRSFPASFPGIIFTESSQNNVLNYAIIKNAYQGIVIGGPVATGAKLTLNETIIDNAYEQGIWALNTSINARNVLVSNCGQNVLLFGGGNYNFTHCTVASFSNAYIPHKKPVLTVADYYKQNNQTISNALTANFTNCILWGEENGFNDDEVIVDKKGSPTPSVTFNKVLWRVKTPPSSNTSTIIGAINANPQFDSVNINKRYFDFRIQKGRSPAIEAGTNANVLIDLDGNQRPRGLNPDLGAYEKQ
jgi:hypothetical protein